jgi:hypothetical protein
MTATEAPRFNHVAISVPAEMLDEEGRDQLARFYREVFGFEPHDVMTVDRKRLVIGAGRVDQFIYIIANDDPMTCPRMDHWGMSVQSEEQLDDYLERAKKFQAQDDRVEIIDKHTDDYSFMSLTAFYVKYLLPMMLEVQFYDYKDTSRAPAPP